MVAGMNQALHWIFKGLHGVMYLAPIGALGGMAYTIGKFGIHSLIPLGKLMISVYATMGIFVFLVLGLILRSCGEKITSFLNYIKAELLIVLGTSSSEAGLPSLMQKLEKMGFTVSSLTNYVDQSSTELIAAAQFKSETAALANIQTGVKSSAALQILSVSPIPQDGSTCGFTASGDVTFSQRTITAKSVKYEDSLCPKALELS